MVSLLDENVKNGLVGIFGKGVDHIEHNRLLALALAYIEGHITNERLRYALNIHKADIAILLKDLCNKNYLRAEGHGRGTKYYLPVNDIVGSNVGSRLKKRMSRRELHQYIIEACQDWMALEDIAVAVERDNDYL